MPSSSHHNHPYLKSHTSQSPSFKKSKKKKSQCFTASNYDPTGTSSQHKQRNDHRHRNHRKRRQSRQCLHNDNSNVFRSSHPHLGTGPYQAQLAKKLLQEIERVEVRQMEQQRKEKNAG